MKSKKKQKSEFIILSTSTTSATKHATSCSLHTAPPFPCSVDFTLYLLRFVLHTVDSATVPPLFRKASNSPGSPHVESHTPPLWPALLWLKIPSSAWQQLFIFYLTTVLSIFIYQSHVAVAHVMAAHHVCKQSVNLHAAVVVLHYFLRHPWFEVKVIISYFFKSKV